MLDPVVVNFIQIHFSRWVVYIMFMRRITRPVSSRRVYLDDHQLIGGEIRPDNIYNLTRSIAPSTQTAGHIVRSNQSRLEFSHRRNPAFRNLANRFGSERNFVAGREINRIRKPVKNIRALADVLGPRTPISYALPAEQDKGAFLIARRSSNDVARLQPPHRHTHPLPSRLFPGQVQEFSRLFHGQLLRVDQKERLAHSASTSVDFPVGCTFTFDILTV